MTPHFGRSEFLKGEHLTRLVSNEGSQISTKYHFEVWPLSRNKKNKKLLVRLKFSIVSVFRQRLIFSNFILLHRRLGACYRKFHFSRFKLLYNRRGLTCALLQMKSRNKLRKRNPQDRSVAAFNKPFSSRVNDGSS